MHTSLQAPPTPTSVLRAGLALAEQVTIDPDTSVVIHHHAYKGDHTLHVAFHPRSAEARRLVMGSPVFAGAAWEFTRYSPTHVGSKTTVDGVPVLVHGGGL